MPHDLIMSGIIAYQPQVLKLHPTIKAFLEGVYDEECVLFSLNGLYYLLRKIWRHVKNYWKENVMRTKSMQDVVTFEANMVSYLNLKNPGLFQHFQILSIRGFQVDEVFFPKSKGLNINMMPFILSRDFQECRLPRLLTPYWKFIISKCILTDEQIGQVCYLTINESRIEEGHLQQRSRIHTEKIARLELCNGLIEGIHKGQGNAWTQRESFYDSRFGDFDQDCLKINGGIFMASNVADSCRVWDCQIMDDSCIGHLGDIEHLRSLLPESEVMEPNCLYWLTDRTPHESLPLKKKTYRQFFRLVTSQVSLWFEEHSTKNPLGVVPDPNITKIVKGSKFKKGKAYIASDIRK